MYPRWITWNWWWVVTLAYRSTGVNGVVPSGPTGVVPVHVESLEDQYLVCLDLLDRLDMEVWYFWSVWYILVMYEPSLSCT